MATHYKQPRRINGVSVTLLVILAAGAWVGVSGWPILSVNGNVKNELAETLPRAYKANLLPEPTSTEAIAKIEDGLLAKMSDLGVTDPKVDVTVGRTEKKVSIEVKYTATMQLKWLDKSYDLAMNPKVETDAKRVEW